MYFTTQYVKQVIDENLKKKTKYTTTRVVVVYQV